MSAIPLSLIAVSSRGVTGAGREDRPGATGDAPSSRGPPDVTAVLSRRPGAIRRGLGR
jgi:hypothetical protein